MFVVVNSTSYNHLILFDGVCNLCNGVVQFVIAKDKAAKFTFAFLQSPAGQAILTDFKLSTVEFDTFVYIKDNKCYYKSRAALEVLKDLGGLWKLLYVFRLVPRILRDCVYDQISKHRYRWFGKRDSCMIPTPELKGRFLESI